MASSSLKFVIVTLAIVLVVFTGTSCADDELSTGFYSKSCPKAFSAIKSVVNSAISKERRIGASLVRLFFHDCFVNVSFFSV